VDYDNGSDSNDGKSTRNPFQNLATAISAAGEWDVIYVRPRDPNTSSGDPYNITPASATNWSIASTKHGLSIIGCGVGFGKSANYQTGLQGYSAVTTSTLTINAPFCFIQNLNFRQGSSTTAAVKASFSDGGSDKAFGVGIYGCTFWQISSSATSGALCMDSAWHSSVIKCHFAKCYRALYIGASNSVPVGMVVDECDFAGLTTDVSADIYTPGAVSNILIKRCYFNHALPAAGSPNLYVSIGATSTGLIADSFFGVADATIANSLTLNGITNAHLWGMSAEIT
jgi:hypothetical protein